ncbi:proteinase B [Saccharomycopsis crataegensis]|uniref:Proteinase B n=1 Tax=Saccharomycopsis crataegensis TaxID=43959 RepID=A0AAV5QW03_9ASCO|nr:proteinase B [Saccharomycopsis crataegensis]
MKLSRSALASVALATVTQGLVIPSIDIDSFLQVSNEPENSHNVVILSPKKAFTEGIAKIKEKVSVSLEDVISEEVQVLSSKTHEVIPNRYMIVFKQGITPDQVQFHQEWIQAEQVTAAGKLFTENPHNEFFANAVNSKLKSAVGGILESFNINDVLTGYSGYFLDSTIELLKKNPLISYIEQDSVVHANEFEVENGAPWGLARISHRDPLNLGSFNKYLYDGAGGEGVISYIIDTGVLDTHEEFEGRAKLIADIPDDGALDGNGHGTHCAGTMGSKTYGVSKKVHIRGVKVLGANGSGTMSDVVKGVEVATKDYIEEVKKNPKLKGASANMSLGGGKSPSLDLAVNAAVKAGVAFSVAAGNENQDACNTSPAAAELAITVGASTISDTRAYFSNWGKCVDIFAPGLNVLSTYIGSNTATATLSGTSMASPHIAGLLAYFISVAPDSASSFGTGKITPAQLKKNLIAYGSDDMLTDVGTDSPNILAFNGAGGDLTEFWSAGSNML